MNIGLITDSISDKSTGIGKYTENFISELPYDAKNNIYTIDYSKKDLFDFKLIFVKNPFKFFKTYMWHNYLPYKIKKEKLDVILNFSGCPHLLPFRQKEILFIYDISWLIYPKWHSFGRVIFYRLLFKTTLKHANVIIVDSKHAKSELIKYFEINKKKIWVIYPLIANNRIRRKAPNYKIPEKFILYIGTLEPRKNIESLIKAYDLLKKEGEFLYKLLICGKKGWLYDSIFNLVEELHLQKNIIFTGFISEEEKYYLLKKATIFVYPTFYEGFGIPLLEALSQGTPVITSNTSSLPEVVGDSALTVDPYKIDELKEAIKEIIINKKLRQKLSLKGKIQAAKFSNSEQIMKLIKYISNKEFLN